MNAQQLSTNLRHAFFTLVLVIVLPACMLAQEAHSHMQPESAGAGNLIQAVRNAIRLRHRSRLRSDGPPLRERFPGRQRSGRCRAPADRAL